MNMNGRAWATFVAFASAFAVIVPHASASGDDAVTIAVTGAGHGFGLAMDGAEGQARAGWTYDRILSLFYPGATNGHADGTVRVGLTRASSVTLSLPGGGVVSDAPRGARAGSGFPVTISPGGRASFHLSQDGVRLDGARADPQPSPAPGPSLPHRSGVSDGQPDLVPTPPPAPPVATPSPTGEPSSPPSPSPEQGGRGSDRIRSLWAWGTGDPGLVRVDALGYRYRGSIEIAARAGSLVVVNHVDLERYLYGIAEARGAGWPIEAMKALAVAARTYAAARMSWFDSNHADGYDICPTDSCQVYHGFDGEEPKMQRATEETSGQVLVYGGRPILAMYHGNGGGQTETYARMADNGLEQYPYLRSVVYPFAEPEHRLVRTTMSRIESSLRASGTYVPGRLERFEILQHGDSPRVVRLALIGSEGEKVIPGRVFAGALGLGSTWFEVVEGGTASVVVTDGRPIVASQRLSDVPVPRSAARPERWWIALLVGILALSLLTAATLSRSPEPIPAPSPAG